MSSDEFKNIHDNFSDAWKVISSTLWLGNALFWFGHLFERSPKIFCSIGRNASLSNLASLRETQTLSEMNSGKMNALIG